MKRINTILAVAILASSQAGAVESSGTVEQRAFNMSFGSIMNQYVDDFGLGVQVTSPYLFDALALRLSGTVQFSRQADWDIWGTVQAGLVGSAGIVAGFTRLYGEGGAVLAFPSGQVSSAGHAWGGYGVFGFEFFTAEASPISYYIEIGATGSGLRADLADNSLIMNGLRIQVGFRGYPWKD